MFVDDISTLQDTATQMKPAEDLGEAFTLLPRFIRSQNAGSIGSPDAIGPRTGSIQNVVLLLADYVAEHLSSFHGEPFVATRYEPSFGRLNANRPWEEAHFQMQWEPLRGGGRRTVYELNVGARDLSFIASVLPADRRDALSLAQALATKQEKLTDLAWENSTRFVQGFDFEAWRRWSLSPSALTRLLPGDVPARFSVCLEAGPITLPVNGDRVSYHVSDAVRRTSNLLLLL